MPKCDKTGPMGMGPMTGRGAGYCTGFTNQSYANPIGCRFGFNRERGFGRKHYMTGLPRGARYDIYNTDNKEILKGHAKLLENQLDDVKKRLEELEE